MAGAGLLSHILVSKFDDHVPLYRQGAIFARLGIDIPRSTLIGWTGSAIAALRLNAATIMTIIETAKANDLNPQAYIADLLNRLPDHKINRLDDLAPWNWKPGQ